MKRAILPFATLGLLALVVADRYLQTKAAAEARVAIQGPADTRSAVVSLSSSPAPTAAEAPDPSTATVTRLARLATRQQISRDGRETYIDSLIFTTDSVVRRWPDRDEPLEVAIVTGGVRDWSPRMAEFVRRALQRWEATGMGVRFNITADTAGAEIVIRWIDRFEFDRAGQTDLTWDQLGHVRRASISLAVRTSAGIALPDAALLAVAVHETGHALGLPHSSDSADVMFPATRTADLSDRDRQTALLLYQLMPGPIGDATAQGR